MNRMASHALTSAEKIAASASAPNQGGSCSMSSVGSTMFGLVSPGCIARAAMPSSAGTNAKIASAAAWTPMPMRTARSFAAP